MPDEGSALALAQLSASFFMIRSAALGPPNGPIRLCVPSGGKGPAPAPGPARARRPKLTGAGAAGLGQQGCRCCCPVARVPSPPLMYLTSSNPALPAAHPPCFAGMLNPYYTTVINQWWVRRINTQPPLPADVLATRLAVRLATCWGWGAGNSRMWLVSCLTLATPCRWVRRRGMAIAAVGTFYQVSDLQLHSLWAVPTAAVS